MNDHYYTAQPHVKSNRHKWETVIEGKTFTFQSDAGVFSKEQVDYGSRVLIRTAFELPYIPGDFLDMGCGYGPIGLTLATFMPERHVEMVDINERAVELAKENAGLNDVSNVSIHPSDLYQDVKGKEFSAIFCNPPIRAGKKTVHHILEEAYHYLALGGKLVIVIQKKQGAPSAQKKMDEVFGNVERVGLDKGFWILSSTKT